MARERPMVASVRNILMLAFMLLILLPYLLTSVYYMLSMVNQLHQESAAAMSADCNLALRNLDLMLDETRRVAYLHLLDSDLARILTTEHSQYDMDYYTDAHIVLNAIKHATNLNANMLSVTFYARSGNVYQLNHVAMANEPQPAWDGDERFYVAPAQGGDAAGGRLLTLPSSTRCTIRRATTSWGRCASTTTCWRCWSPRSRRGRMGPATRGA